MKKILLSVMILCLGITLPMHAENTDISTLENVVYIEPFSVAAGNQHIISVKMKNSVEAEGFGFDLYLPEGVTVALEDEFPMVELSTERTTTKKTNSFDAAFQSNGCLRVLAASTNASVISGNDGEVCLVTINVAANKTAGEYPVYLRNIAISDSQAHSHRTDEVETTITITAADTRTILDETSTTAPESANDVDVRVKRTIKAGEWSSLCLPFSMTAEQVMTTFGDDVQLGDFNGCDIDENTNDITVKFNDATAIEANHPYIIKVSSNITEFTVDGVDIAPEDDPAVDKDEVTTGSGRNKKTTYNSFIGTYVANTTVPDYALFLSNNKFWFSTGNTKMKAFRAYFDLASSGAEYPDPSAARVILSFDEGTTSIRNINSNRSDEHVVYNLNGQQVRVRTKGLYIKNNKKIVVK